MRSGGADGSRQSPAALLGTGGRGSVPCQALALRVPSLDRIEMRVTAKAHPLLFEAFEARRCDVAPQLPRPAYYKVPEQFDNWVDDAERGMATLADQDERDTFAIGPHDAIFKMRDRSPELAKAYELLEAFFEDAEWTAQGGWGRHYPSASRVRL